MTGALTLALDIRTYWLHARGEGGGADFDLVMETDADGFPLLRGRHVAGLLRLALERARAWQWFEEDDFADIIPDLLGGTRVQREPDDPKKEKPRKRRETIPGCLDIRSARVPDRLRRALIPPGVTKEDEAARYEALFRRIDSTAIDEIRGVAKQAHLRSVEAAIPLPLVFDVHHTPEDLLAWVNSLADKDERKAEMDAVEAAEKRWQTWLGIAWPALDEVGAKRTRGFGRLGYTPLKAEGERS